MKKNVKKFFAKKFLWLILTVLVVITAMIIGIATKPAHAKRVANWEGDTLIIRTVPDPEEIQGRPEGLLAEDARKLVDGELPEKVIKDKYGKNYHSFAFPQFRSRAVYLDRVVT